MSKLFFIVCFINSLTLTSSLGVFKDYPGPPCDTYEFHDFMVDYYRDNNLGVFPGTLYKICDIYKDKLAEDQRVAKLNEFLRDIEPRFEELYKRVDEIYNFIKTKKVATYDFSLLGEIMKKEREEHDRLRNNLKSALSPTYWKEPLDHPGQCRHPETREWVSQEAYCKEHGREVKTPTMMPLANRDYFKCTDNPNKWVLDPEDCYKRPDDKHTWSRNC